MFFSFLYLFSICIYPPLFYQLLSYRPEFRNQKHFLAGSRMHKPQRLGMECLPGTDSKAVLYELFISCKSRSFQYFISAITFIVEKRMADIFHMHTDLMRTSRLQAAFHQCHISQTFQHGVMGNGRLSLISFGNTVICIRSRGSRPILPSIRPSSSFTMPHTRARYSRLVVLLKNCILRCAFASGFLATTSNRKYLCRYGEPVLTPDHSDRK